MTDTDKLKRLAEMAREFGEFAAGALSCAEYLSAASPQAILALIAENEALNVYGRDVAREAVQYRKERDEAVALLREWDRVGIDGTGGNSLEENTEDFLARIDADNNSVA